MENILTSSKYQKIVKAVANRLKIAFRTNVVSYIISLREKRKKFHFEKTTKERFNSIIDMFVVKI